MMRLIFLITMFTSSAFAVDTNDSIGRIRCESTGRERVSLSVLYQYDMLIGEPKSYLASGIMTITIDQTRQFPFESLEPVSVEQRRRGLSGENEKLKISFEISFSDETPNGVLHMKGKRVQLSCRDGRDLR